MTRGSTCHMRDLHMRILMIQTCVLVKMHAHTHRDRAMTRRDVSLRAQTKHNTHTHRCPHTRAFAPAHEYAHQRTPCSQAWVPHSHTRSRTGQKHTPTQGEGGVGGGEGGGSTYSLSEANTPHRPGTASTPQTTQASRPTPTNTQTYTYIYAHTHALTQCEG